MTAARAAAVLLLAIGIACEPTASAPAPTVTRTATPSSRTAAPTAPTASAPTPTASAPAPTASAPAPTATATAAATAPPSSATPALGSCAAESTMRSQPGTSTVQLLFVNDAGARLDVSVLDGQGKRVPKRTLQPGESYAQQAGAGDVWVVTDASGGCVTIHTAVASALVIVSPGRNSVLPLYAVRGRVTDARSGAGLPNQTVYIWKPDDGSCAVIGGSGSPGHVVASITAPDGTYAMYVSPGDYKVRVATTPVGGVSYAAQWWRGRPAGPDSACRAADVARVAADLTADFALQPQ